MCYAARTGLVRLVGRLLVGMGALSDTAAFGGLGDRGTCVMQRSRSAVDEGRLRLCKRAAVTFACRSLQPLVSVSLKASRAAVTRQQCDGRHWAA